MMETLCKKPLKGNNIEEEKKKKKYFYTRQDSKLQSRVLPPKRVRVLNGVGTTIDNL
jgi:hypothetical protein